MQDVDTLLDGQANKVNELAEKHSVRPEYIKKLINPIMTYQKKQVPTLPNMIAHVKAMEINEGKRNVWVYLMWLTMQQTLDLPAGEKEELQRLKRIVENDKEIKNLTIEDQGHIKSMLIKYHKINRSGVRPSNRAAAQDACWTVDQVSKEVRTVSSYIPCSQISLSAWEPLRTYRHPCLSVCYPWSYQWQYQACLVWDGGMWHFHAWHFRDGPARHHPEVWAVGMCKTE